MISKLATIWSVPHFHMPDLSTPHQICPQNLAHRSAEHLVLQPPRNRRVYRRWGLGTGCYWVIHTVPVVRFSTRWEMILPLFFIALEPSLVFVVDTQWMLVEFILILISHLQIYIHLLVTLYSMCSFFVGASFESFLFILV